ncbi:MAG: 3'-5' exonuclease [Rhodospirillaceae bacterium]|nr:MAG: 3'-5' exonuclease [Rhodospirillaceae bacterium]
MKALVFDVETTGLPNYRLPFDDPSQPRVASIAAILVDGDGAEISTLEALISPDGWEMPADLEKLHGLSTDILKADGRPVAEVLNDFAAAVEQCDLLVAYGIQFDLKLVRGEWVRAGLPSRGKRLPEFCVMKAVTPICKMPPTEKMLAAGINGPKTPKLAEAIKIIFGEEMDGAHRAIHDVRATIRLFHHLKTLGLVNVGVPL